MVSRYKFWHSTYRHDQPLQQVLYHIVPHTIRHLDKYPANRQHSNGSDSGIVILIAFIGFTIYQRSKSVPTYNTSYHVALYLFPLTLFGMWIHQDSFDFNILLHGVAWRTYFFLSILSHALHLWKSEQHL